MSQNFNKVIFYNLWIWLCLKTADEWEMGVVRWCKGVVYLALSGRPTDIGLQLGKACYPCSR